MPALLDLTDSRFGRLVVAARAPSRKERTYWRCLCDCGTTVEVAAQSLRRGLSQSCGCLAREIRAESGRRSVKDLTGRRFGRLLILERDFLAEEERGISGAIWKCQCDCGVVKSCLGTTLLRNTLRSCGCLARELAGERGRQLALPSGEAAFNELWGRYQRQARERALEFHLSMEEFRGLIQQNCFYCGAPPSNEVSARYGRNGGLVYSGLDRKDGSRGYLPDNVVPCCVICNRAKNLMSVEEFAAWVQRVSTHLGRTRVRDANATG